MRALITGITGQDGSYLAELLLEKGYEVHGMVRRCSRPVTERIDHLIDQLQLHQGDLVDQTSLDRVINTVSPDEVYHLAAQTFVGTSWEQPVATTEITGLGTLRMLEAVRAHAPAARFYQAGSSEMFGNQPAPHSESTPFTPRSPYGAAKVFAHQIAVNYRESYGMYVACGILFNHESVRRGREFVTRKIARQVAEVAMGTRLCLSLGNTSARRDWGWAPDYVRAMWLMLQQDAPGDYVVATGETHSIQDFIDIACDRAGTGVIPVTTDPAQIRPAELHVLRGDASKARRVLEWEPTTSFTALVNELVDYELAQAAAQVKA